MTPEYPWLTTLAGQWKALLANDRLTGALLLSGRAGLGLESLVDYFAQSLVCGSADGEACGFCHQCELAKTGAHPDIHRVSPEKAGKNITVDQIRQCNRWAQESSQMGGKRLLVIEPAEAMNEAAANALLKTLEEPAENCVFLLVTANKAALLPTIVSRCQSWHLAAPAADVTRDWLAGQLDKPVDDAVMTLCHGAPLSVLAFCQQGAEKEYRALEQKLEQFLTAPVADPGVIWGVLKEETTERLYWLSHLLLQVQKAHFGAVSSANGLTALLSYDSAYKMCVELNQLIGQMKQFPGLNQELLVFDWLLKLHGKRNVC